MNFARLLEINPGRGINRSDNPRIYEKNIAVAALFGRSQIKRRQILIWPESIRVRTVPESSLLYAVEQNLKNCASKGINHLKNLPNVGIT